MERRTTRRRTARIQRRADDNRPVSPTSDRIARPPHPAWPQPPARLPIAAVVSAAGLVAVLVWGLLVRDDTSALGFLVWFNGLRNPLLDGLAAVVAVGLSPAAAVAIGVLFALLVAWRTRSILVGLGAGFAVAAGWLSSGAIKVIVDRPRPDWAALTNHIGVAETDASFPSGHVAFAASLAVVATLLVWRTRHRWWVMAAGLVLTALAAVGRLYAGVHDPSDVIAAALCGLFGGVLAYAVAGWLLGRIRTAR